MAKYRIEFTFETGSEEPATPLWLEDQVAEYMAGMLARRNLTECRATKLDEGREVRIPLVDEGDE